MTIDDLIAMAERARAADDPDLVYCDKAYHALHDALPPAVVTALCKVVQAADRHFESADLYPDDYAEARAELDAALGEKP